ncbi:11462_t:CDS:2 [Gigaspora margarita]|uniref:11462_t:CDS:1 n=1 Tax=Gigaspora margarita TaxID=4874 RepID=A0ABN7VD68_GIGMA|nr:11462_t:CDS:2 [Gigaspora margarita]
MDTNKKNRKLACCKCGQKAFYREKTSELYCQKCHANGKEVSYKTYTGNDLVTNTTYIKCPHCGMGDTCGTDGCYVYKRCRCGLLVAGSCSSDCEEVTKGEKEREKNREQTNKYNKYREELEKIDANNITGRDYLKIKDLKSKTECLLKEEIESGFRNSIEIFLKKLEEMENGVPQQAVIKAKWIDENRGQTISENCRHSNIHWRELFQENKVESAYCLGCGEDKNANYYDNWWDLKRGKFFENIKEEFLVFQDMSKYIEEYCCEFAREEGVGIPERTSAKLKELERKNKDNSSEKPKNDKIGLYIGLAVVGCLVVFGITGHGKSTLANVLVGKEICKESAGGASETKNFQKDNRGISEEVILYEIGKSIYAAKEGIDQVFFVFRGKFSQKQIKSFKLFEKLILESGITKFTTLVRTNFENFRSTQKCEEDQQALLKESTVIREIIESCNGIVHIDNEPIPEVDEDDSDNEKEIRISKDKREESRKKVLKHLEEKRQERQEEVYKLKE